MDPLSHLPARRMPGRRGASRVAIAIVGVLVMAALAASGVWVARGGGPGALRQLLGLDDPKHPIARLSKRGEGLQCVERGRQAAPVALVLAAVRRLCGGSGRHCSKWHQQVRRVAFGVRPHATKTRVSVGRIDQTTLGPS